ncbi:hypothetical protein BKA82DRAFT_296126 [Pisolithus tinctorius]|nr:hypothetical protein BKA82DRAFT_296126 [Pisolithus tinctorius]
MINGIIYYYSAMFGLEYLKIFVGEITFFERLPSIMETQLCCEASAGPAGENRLSEQPSKRPFRSWVVTRNLFKCRLRSKARQNSAVERNPRHEVAIPLLVEKWKALGKGNNLIAKRELWRKVTSISQFLGIGLFEHICATLRASEDKQ